MFVLSLSLSLLVETVQSITVMNVCLVNENRKKKNQGYMIRTAKTIIVTKY